MEAMSTPTASRHVSTVIRCAPAEVYAYAADPDHLPAWAAGLAQAEVTREGDTLLVDSPMGRVTVRFVPANDLGVLDHDVTLPSGTTVTNPVRVLAHPEGAEVVFTVRQIELSDDEFENDVRTVAADLGRLRSILEEAAVTPG
ncbi:Polyketide cyclase / dehydrase and lipid transport [Nocardioides lianchengensis]|uniref:Polyketide cyclase / dehydrase and lipid transport n=2 Tax=Nocardioides lianchengensis TaxID=1045774 RepID=A0A1G7AC74_9ACTN|nr:Polyketide cyclase / dehydrase and lipid transport [Nocardioides lianchengensis]